MNLCGEYVWKKGWQNHESCYNIYIIQQKRGKYVISKRIYQARKWLECNLW
jgi:hypothetical protein